MNIFSKLETFAYRNIVVPLQGKATFDFVENHYKKGMKTLDFGCGTGSNSKLFHAEDYIGAEVDMSRVQSSREKHVKYTFEKIPIIHSTKEQLPWEKDSFDLIFVSLCLHHINAKTCKLIFKEFHRVLKQDGFVVIRCPDIQRACELVGQDKLLEAIYESPVGPVSPIDIIFGNRKQIAKGNKYMAKKGGFTYSVLNNALGEAGFQIRYGGRIKNSWELSVVAFKQKKSEEEIKRMADPFFI